MSDADRLREAAKEADRIAVYLHGTMTPTMHHVAGLLRAVADDLEIGLYIVGAESPAAALALADVILGDNNE